MALGILIGQVGLDVLIGQVGLDVLIGQVGLDVVIGHVGLDVVIGHVGLDVVIGQVGLEDGLCQLGLLTSVFFYYYASNTEIYFHNACVFLEHIIIYKHYATLLFCYHDACDRTVYAMKSSQAQV